MACGRPNPPIARRRKQVIWSIGGAARARKGETKRNGLSVCRTAKLQLSVASQAASCTSLAHDGPPPSADQRSGQDRNQCGWLGRSRQRGSWDRDGVRRNVDFGDADRPDAAGWARHRRLLAWLQTKLAGPHRASSEQVETWPRSLRDGGPRVRPRNIRPSGSCPRAGRGEFAVGDYLGVVPLAS